MTLISDSLQRYIDEGEGFMETKQHEPDETKFHGSITSPHGDYVEGYFQLSAVGKEQLQSLIDKALREAYKRGYTQGGIDEILRHEQARKDVEAELTQHKSEESSK